MYDNLRYAIRGLARRPAFTLAAVATLAITLGFMTAIWSVFRGVLLEPLPFANASELLVLQESHPDKGIEGFSVPTYEDLRQRVSTLTATSAYRNQGFAFTGGQEPREVPGLRVTPGFFPLLGASVFRGRAFGAEETIPGRDHVVIVSHGFWRGELGGTADVLGQVLELDAEPYEIVGVMPPGFEFPPDSGVRIWAALAFDPEDGHDMSRDVRGLGVVARRQAGTSTDEVRQELKTISTALATTHTGSMTGWEMQATGLHEQLVSGVRSRLLLLLGAVAVLLAVAVTNLANLSLAQLLARQREIAVRLSLGAVRKHLLRQFLTESLLLTSVGGLIGLGLASLATAWVRGFSSGILPRQDQVKIDAGVVLFAFALAVLVALAFGLIPAWRAGRPALVRHLHSSQGAPPASHRLGNALVVAQVALALVLTVAAGLLIRSFDRLAAVEPGFAPDRVLAANIFLPRVKYPETHQRRTFFDTVLAELEAAPEIEMAGGATALPMNEVGLNFDVPFQVEGKPMAAEGEESQADFRIATPGYFSTLGIEIRSGRGFDQRDHDDAPQVMLINQTLARRFFPEENPLGQFMSFPMGGRREVVGVVGDIKHYGLANEARPEMYLPFAQRTFSSLALVARAVGEPEQAYGAIRDAVRRADPEQAIYQLTTLRGLIDKALFLPRLQMLILMLFAACSCLLAGVGLYGVMAAQVAERTHEIGVRLALGAGKNDVMWMVVRRGMRLAGLGILFGLLASSLLTQLISTVLFEVDPLDPSVLALAAVSFAAIALLANVLPAFRAMQVDPVVILAAE